MYITQLQSAQIGIFLGVLRNGQWTQAASCLKCWHLLFTRLPLIFQILQAVNHFYMKDDLSDQHIIRYAFGFVNSCTGFQYITVLQKCTHLI